MVSMFKQVNERTREGSNTTEESVAEIQEQSGASHRQGCRVGSPIVRLQLRLRAISIILLQLRLRTNSDLQLY